MTAQIIKPMLAETCEELDSLTFPVLATPKLDGIRCLMVKGEAVIGASSRSQTISSASGSKPTRQTVSTASCS